MGWNTYSSNSSNVLLYSINYNAPQEILECTFCTIFCCPFSRDVIYVPWYPHNFYVSHNHYDREQEPVNDTILVFRSTGVNQGGGGV